MEFAASLVSATVEVGTEIIFITTIALLTVILAYLILPTAYQYLYGLLDKQNQPVHIRGMVINKRYYLDYWSAQVEIRGVLEDIQLPRALFETIEVGDEIDLSVIQGRLSHRLLSVKPIVPQIDTYA